MKYRTLKGRLIAPLLTTTALTLLVGASYPVQRSNYSQLSAQAQAQPRQSDMTLSALDARYAVSEGTVVSLFVHPLASLTERDLRSGLSQVVTADDTFGTSYSSGDTGFGLVPQEGQRDRLSI